MSKCPIPWNQKFDKNKKYIWISEKGTNTCEECKNLDKKYLRAITSPSALTRIVNVMSVK